MSKKTRSRIASSAFFKKLMLIAGLMLFAVVCGIFFMSKPARMPQNVTDTNAEPIYQDAIVFTGQYHPMMYDVKEGYPQNLIRQLQAVPASQQVPLRCSGHIVSEDAGFLVRDANTHESFIKITDPYLLKHLQSIKDSISSPHELLSVKICENESKDVIIEYTAGIREGHHSDYGIDTAAYLTWIPYNSSFTTGVKVIDYPRWPYPNCRKPLVLTKNSILYYECGITTEDEVNATYHRVDFTKQTSTQIAKCIYTYHEGTYSKTCR